MLGPVEQDGELMSESGAGTSALGHVVRLSVVAGDRRVDIAAPAGVPVAELVPGLAQDLNLLDPTTVHYGFGLSRTDGVDLDQDRSLQAQGIADGDVLNLTSGADAEEHRVYDDLVEAVADVVEGDQKPWSPQDAATTATLASVTLLVTGAILLGAAGFGGASLLVTVAAALTGVLLLVSAAVIARVGGPPAAPVALVFVGSIYAGVAGLTALGADVVWGTPTLFTGLGLLASGTLGLILLTERREFALVPGVIGLLLTLVGLSVNTFNVSPGAAFSVAVAIAGLAGIGIPWIALAATPLRVVSAREDKEILADPAQIDAEQVASNWGKGHRIQVSLRIALGVTTLIATPVVVGTGLFGLALAVLAYCGMMLSVRETYSRLDVAAVMSIAVGGFAVTGIAAALMHPGWRIALTIGVGALGAIIVALSLVNPKRRLRLGRLADAAELVCLAALLPLALVAGNLF